MVSLIMSRLTVGRPIMSAWGFIKLALVFAVSGAAAHAQDQPDTDALRTSLSETLSLVTLGAVSVKEPSARMPQSGRITRSGTDFLVQLSLNGFAAPPSAAAEAVAHPDVNGAWEVTSIAFPSAGALGRSIDQAVSYTIGQQAIHARLDPALKTRSTLTADLGAIMLHSIARGQDSEHSIEHITVDGHLSPTSDGRLDLLARDTVTNWHATARDPAGQEADGRVRHVDGHFALSGLDRAQAVRFMAAARSFMETAKPPNRPPDLTATGNNGLRGVLDATVGLLTRVEANETLDRLKFDLGHGNAGTLGRLQLRLNGGAEDQRLNAAVDVAMDEPSLANLSGDAAAFVPHHLSARPVLAGAPLGPLMALLRAAIAPNPDRAALQRQAAALLATEGARAGVEAIAFDAGPVHVLGSVRFQPRADGEVGADIHVSVIGSEGLLTQLESKPGLQGVLPFVLLAKGLGRAQGDSMIWDVSIGGGPLTVNGVAFGQPPSTR